MGENPGAGPAEEDLRRLADLITEHNRIAARMTALIGRPAIIGHLGEYIASKVFDIRLEESAVNKGFDGRFASGPLAGKTVDVKFYGKLEGLLDIRVDAVPDFYLVLTGPRSPAMSSRGEERLWSIEGVYLFDAPALVERLRARGLKLGVATSVRREHWEAAEVYPEPRCLTCRLTERQVQLLRLFSSRRGAMSVSLAEVCIYTIAHGELLAAAEQDGGPATFHESRPWKTGRQLWLEAQEAGLPMPVLLGDATDCTRILYWGLLTDVEIGPTGTKYVVDRLRRLAGDHTPQELVLRKTGEHIAPKYIYPYTICRTPGFLE